MQSGPHFDGRGSFASATRHQGKGNVCSMRVAAAIERAIIAIRHQGKGNVCSLRMPFSVFCVAPSHKASG